MLKDDTRRRAYDAAWRHSRTSSQSPGEQGAGHGKGDAFSFEMNGQQLTFEELFALLKQWEVQVPDNVRDATRLFKSFVDVSHQPKQDMRTANSPSHACSLARCISAVSRLTKLFTLQQWSKKGGQKVALAA